MSTNPVCSLLGIKYPIIQGGMAWIADAALASAVSNAGGFGIIAAGSAPANYVRGQIREAKTLTDKPFGVNIMLMNPNSEEIVNTVCEEGVAAVTTGAGNPARFIPLFRSAGIKVLPVVASSGLAKLMARSGASAVVAEGSEAGGHIGELTTMVLVPDVCDSVDIPVVAAGGIADGRGMAAAFMLGASAVQIGTRFVASEECTAHINYKEKILKAKDIDTFVTGRSTGHPARVLRNNFTRTCGEMEKSGASLEEMEKFFSGTLRMAAKDGDVTNGGVHAGQSAALVHKIMPVADIIEEIVGQARALLGNGAAL